jgi:cell division septum initiation protein DivIVA
MSLSEKIKNIRFSKGAIGYSVKEVDAFVGESLTLASDCEMKLHTLRAKLDAFECRTDEIAKREDEAAAVLEAAKKEAASIIGAAKAEGEKEIEKSRLAAEKIIEDAKADATEITVKAKVEARVLIEKAAEKSAEINQKAAALVKTCECFEAQFRSEVAKTVKNLAEIKNNAPKVKAENPVKSEVKPEAFVEKAQEPMETQDYAFVGGRRLDTAFGGEKKQSRKVYDTLSVTYDSNFDGEFEDVKKIKEDILRKGIKNPVEFSE